jgi:hypothetical protein
MNVFLRILTEIWQLPQHIIAYIIMLVNRKSIEPMVSKDDDIHYYLVDHLFDCGVSLGNYIFLDIDGNHNYMSVRHEHGHQIQSLILGPLYLIFIGLPSIVGNTINRIKRKYFEKNYDPDFYYKQPWEAWADKLGGVDRKSHKDIKKGL